MDARRVPMDVHRMSYGFTIIPMDFPDDVFWMSIGSPLTFIRGFSHRRSEDLETSGCTPMDFRRNPYGHPHGFLWIYIGIPMDSHRTSYGLPWGPLWMSIGMPMQFHRKERRSAFAGGPGQPRRADLCCLTARGRQGAQICAPWSPRAARECRSAFAGRPGQNDESNLYQNPYGFLWKPIGPPIGIHRQSHGHPQEFRWKSI